MPTHRTAARDPAGREPQALAGAMALDGLDGVGRTARVEAAGRDVAGPRRLVGAKGAKGGALPDAAEGLRKEVRLAPVRLTPVRLAKVRLAQVEATVVDGADHRSAPPRPAARSAADRDAAATT